MKRYKARYPQWRKSLPWADPKVARRIRAKHKRVRTLVDGLLLQTDPAKIIEALDTVLLQVKVTPSLALRSRLGLPPGPGGSPFALRWWTWSRRNLEQDQALDALVRLYDSGYWDSLRKCPTCGTYFLAGGYRRKKYCKRECMWVALQRRYRSRVTETKRKRLLARRRERYYLRLGRPPSSVGRPR